MKTTNKTEILKKFENKEFVQINFPQGLTDETPIYMRSEIQSLDHFNTIYKDGNKYYLEDTVEAESRVCSRAKVSEAPDTWENACYCLYLAKYDMKEAVKLLRGMY